MKFLIGLFTFIGIVILFVLAIFIPSYAIKTGVDLIFGTNINLLGVFFLLFSLIMIKTIFFDREED